MHALKTGLIRPAFILLIAILIGLSGCTRTPQEFKNKILAFGTIVDITLYDVSEEQAKKAIQSIEADLKYMHYAYHPWKQGPMGRVNMLLAMNSSFTANPILVDLISQAKELSIKSQGLFNPAIGKLVALWGFHQDERPPDPPPEAAQIEKLLAELPGMQSIAIDNFNMNNTHPQLKLDLGGIAKGYALDMIMQTLPSFNIQNAIINAGGDLKAIGNHGDRPWRVGIRNPRGKGVIASLNVKPGESVFTSGDYERFFNHAGRRYHHILDPRSGYPAEGLVSVTVVHHNAATADAASTALFVAGEKWPEIASAMGVQDVMVIDAQGRTQFTPSMHKRVDFIVAPKEVIERKLP